MAPSAEAGIHDVGKILLLGESWFVHSTHQKGFDAFTTSEYAEGGAEFCTALRASGWDVEHIPAHRIQSELPTDPRVLSDYSCIVISDVGSNTFLLSEQVFKSSISETNRLVLIRDYILAGGSLLMVGGYLSFSGIDARARYARSPLGPLLPVEVLEVDDRVECPEGVRPQVQVTQHEALPREAQRPWPHLLGYNRTLPRPEGTVLVRIGDDPLIAVREVGAGRTAVFTSDLAPHWAPPPFLEWDGYGPMWHSLLTWLGAGGRGATGHGSDRFRDQVRADDRS